MNANKSGNRKRSEKVRPEVVELPGTKIGSEPRPGSEIGEGSNPIKAVKLPVPGAELFRQFDAERGFDQSDTAVKKNKGTYDLSVRKEVIRERTSDAMFAHQQAKGARVKSNAAGKGARDLETSEGDTMSALISPTVAEHLHLFELYGRLSVAEFRDYSQTGLDAAHILIGYRTAGWLDEEWITCKTVFMLSSRGRALLNTRMPAGDADDAKDVATKPKAARKAQGRH